MSPKLVADETSGLDLQVLCVPGRLAHYLIPFADSPEMIRSVGFLFNEKRIPTVSYRTRRIREANQTDKGTPQLHAFLLFLTITLNINSL